MKNAIYKHTKGGLYQLMGLGAIQAAEGHSMRDLCRVVISRETDGYRVTDFTPVEGGSTPPDDHILGRLQLSTGYKLTNNASVVVYRGEDGGYWVRLEKEFNDGRFVKQNADGTFPEHVSRYAPDPVPKVALAEVGENPFTARTASTLTVNDGTEGVHRELELRPLKKQKDEGK
jgi:hypothetical protein